MKLILSLAALLLAIPAWAEEVAPAPAPAPDAATPVEAASTPGATSAPETTSTPSKPYSAHNYHFGVHAGAALPSQFSNDGFKGSLGLGWGFALGWHGFKHWDFEFRTNNSFQTAKPGIGDAEDLALETSTSVNAKFYPSKEGEISFYALAGLGLQSLSVTEEGSFLSLNEPDEPTFFGHHWALGLGLEQTMRAPFSFWTDLSLQHQSYGSVMLDEQTRDLDPSGKRWSVVFRAGISAGFW
jgi:hypothetical protein